MAFEVTAADALLIIRPDVALSNLFYPRHHFDIGMRKEDSIYVIHNALINRQAIKNPQTERQKILPLLVTATLDL
ncbi:hypothetical protein ACTZGB_17460 [Yersinia bercovieri]